MGGQSRAACREGKEERARARGPGSSWPLRHSDESPRYGPIRATLERDELAIENALTSENGQRRIVTKLGLWNASQSVEFP